jgi:hypothetical protein
MVFDWLKRLGKKSRPSNDRADRNAVIRRIVSAAADEGRPQRPPLEPAPAPTAAGAAPPRFTEDGRPITPLPAGKPSSGATPPPTPRTPEPADAGVPRERVAERAFEIWVRKGRPVGTADQDWAQAEAELRAEMLYRPADGGPAR